MGAFDDLIPQSAHRAGAFDDLIPQQPKPERHQDLRERLARNAAGMLLGASSTTRGLLQLAGMELDPVNMAMLKSIAEGGTPGEIAGAVVDPVGLAFPPARSSTALRAIGKGALIGGGMAAAQPVEEGDSRLVNAALGAAGGAGVTTAMRGVEKAVNVARGRIPGEAADLTTLARQHDVPVSAGDISGNPFQRRAELMTEQVPVVGMGGFREGQQRAAQRAASRMVEDLHALVPGDLGATAQRSMNNRAAQLRDTASRLYGRVADLAGDAPVPTTRTSLVARDLLERELKKKPAHQNASIVNTLQSYVDDPGYDFTTLQAVRSDLGDAIADHKRGVNTVIGKKGVGIYSALRQAMTEDMAAFASEGGGDLQRSWRAADHFYRTRVVPFRDRALARSMDRNEVDTIFSDFIKKGQRDRAAKFYRAMDDEGRAATRAWIVQDAYEEATRSSVFSPARFAARIKQQQKAIGVFFPAQQRREIEGFANLMQHIERAGQFAESQPTGNRIFQLVGPAGIVGAGVSGGTGGVAASVGAVGLFRLMSTTGPGRSLLLAASRVEPGSEGMAKILAMMEMQLPRLTGQAAANR